MRKPRRRKFNMLFYVERRRQPMPKHNVHKRPIAETRYHEYTHMRVNTTYAHTHIRGRKKREKIYDGIYTAQVKWIGRVR